jgi:hypothetical protein
MALRESATHSVRSWSAWPAVIVTQRSASLALLLGPLFWLAWQIDPLYADNQNTKFLQALASAGLGFLDQDWLARTEDGLPAFTLLSRVIYETLGPNGFYLAAFATHTLFLFCALVIYRRVSERHAVPMQGTALFVAIVFAVATITDLHELLLWGFSEQYILDQYFQTADFGVFLMVSVLLFEKRAIAGAVACTVLAAVMHPAYVIPAMVLIGAYAIYDLAYCRGDGTRPTFTRAGLCLLGVAALASVSLFIKLRFTATDPASQLAATSILTNFRIPHHADPLIWFNFNVVMQFAICLAAATLLPPGRYRFVIRMGTAALAVFTALAFVPHLETYRLIAPWRLSATIVPLAAFALCALGIVKIHRSGYFKPAAFNGLMWTCAAVVLVSTAIGAGFTAVKFMRPEPRAFAFVRANLASGQQYLTPAGMMNFRLLTGAPQYVSHKSHPYQDVEILEWHRRLKLASSLYVSAGMDCQALQRLAKDEGVTHVLTVKDPPVSCDFASKVFEDGPSRVYRLTAGSSPAR